eukprot:4255949-Amphidinium_carterae.1
MSGAGPSACIRSKIAFASAACPVRSHALSAAFCKSKLPLALGCSRACEKKPPKPPTWAPSALLPKY